MSEYQYYEFLALDQPLSAADQDALRDLSTRARITATSFRNHYEWGDFKGDPAKLMERWFDLHLYFANWGSRRLMMRLPKRLVDRAPLDRLLRKVDSATLWAAGEHLILDIRRDEIEIDDWEDDGSGWLAALMPLRADVLGGDLRLFYLLWLMAVEWELVDDNEAEPMSGIGPMTGALQAFVEFFDIDRDLVRAAAERTANATIISPDIAHRAIAGMTDREKTEALLRLLSGDPHVAAELRADVRRSLVASDADSISARTVGDLRARAREMRLARERRIAAREAAAARREAKAAEKARKARLEAIARRGDTVWAEIEGEIKRRNPKGYDAAASLLQDLKVLAEERGTIQDFARRLDTIRAQHAGKRNFIDRLAALE